MYSCLRGSCVAKIYSKQTILLCLGILDLQSFESKYSRIFNSILPCPKPRATPTKIVERRPLQLTSNKNLNNVVKKANPKNSSNLPTVDQVDRNKRLMLSDTSRLSRNMSKGGFFSTVIIFILSPTMLYCDAETIMRRYNNVEVSQCVLFDREKTIGNCFPSS